MLDPIKNKVYWKRTKTKEDLKHDKKNSSFSIRAIEVLFYTYYYEKLFPITVSIVVFSLKNW